MRLRGGFLLCVLAVAVGRADPVEELARIHLDALGGAKRVGELKAMRATGHVIAAGTQMRFTLLATRPDRVRIETEQRGRTLVQGSDGVAPPWEYDAGASPPKLRVMNPGVAKVFAADAEFDDPLVAGKPRGFTLDYAGEMMFEGRKLLRVLVTRNLAQTFSVLLDDETFLIVKRVEQRGSAGGRTLHVVTHYDDFRPVNGVLLPHVVTLSIDGKATQQTRIAQIEANPVLEDAVFSPPLLGPAPAVSRPASAAPQQAAGGRAN